MTWASARVVTPVGTRPSRGYRPTLIWLSWKLAPAVKTAAHRAEVVRMRVLRVQSFLQTRIVLLEGVAVHRIVQVEGEVGIEIEERAAERSRRP